MTYMRHIDLCRFEGSLNTHAGTKILSRAALNMYAAKIARNFSSNVGLKCQLFGTIQRYTELQTFCFLRMFYIN